MATFATLNEDVLVLIFSHLENDRPALYALALTCSLASRIATQLLYRKLSLSFRRSEPDRRFDLLLRSLNQPNRRRRLQLTSYIHDVRIAWQSDHPAMRHPDTIDFLRSIDKLRKLSLFVSMNPPVLQYRPGHRMNLSRRADLSFWHVSTLHHLRELHLYLEDPTDHLARFMCLTPVDIITVRPGRDQLKPETFSAHNLPRRPKPLTKLELWTHYSYESLTNIFAATSGVKHLGLFEPGIRSGRTNAICQDGLAPIMATTYSPHALCLALAPLHDTLTTLDLSSDDTLHWPHHDDTRLDLRPFTHLTRATTDSKCFFPASTPPARRASPHPLLPPSLSSLTLLFDTATTALGPDGSAHHWLLALVQSSSSSSTPLRTLAVLERNHEGVAFCEVCVPVAGIYPWEPPAAARRLLRVAASSSHGLEVKVELRVWRRPDPEDMRQGVPGVPGSREGGPPVRVPGVGDVDGGDAGGWDGGFLDV
ncbi:uncharacterized protein BKCO1_37000205 [Diplodia corticola]|uniref:F-box domain-containing protein n=1 Tax=Diplodia corticola TaxID=236234 RepID=A0A1J9RJ57_9PEZI|nr:uncharacterized protein BKCO1_37000205 [Diplodia corticola]OJD32595.1 hypothetical protein BKCO1_37000205 [Diplodia corticola]